MKPYLFFLLFLPTLLVGQINPSLLQQPWSAYWINMPNQPAMAFGVYLFRKEIELAQKPSSFIVHVSADNRYKLYVNGNLVSLGPARGELYHWNFETVDLEPYLQAGKNTLAAIVWNFGEHTPEAQISWKTAFILQGNSHLEEVANTNNSWRCTKDESYAPLPPTLIYSYYVAGPGEKIDFNKKISGWMSTGFDDALWNKAQPLQAGLPKGAFAHALGWLLVPRTIPPMELKPQRLATVREKSNVTIPDAFPSTSKSFTIPAHTQASILLDQGVLTNAYPMLSFSKGKDALLSIAYAEALYVQEGSKNWRAEQQKGNRNETKGKRFVGVMDQLRSNGKDNQLFTPLAWRTYRYVKLDVETKEEALIVDDFHGLFTGYPFAMNASFDAQQPELDKMLEVGWRTARLCAVETYMDCPYYEQLQYVGDTRIQALVSLYNSGDDRLVRQAITLIDQSRMAEGITLSRYPTAHAQEIAPFSLWWIGMAHDYWMYRPDEKFVRDRLPGIRQVLHWFNTFQREDGSLRKPYYWNFSDWATTGGWKDGVAPIGADGSSSVLDFQLLWAYQLASELEGELGMKALSEDYAKKAGQLKETLRNKYWDDSKKMFSDVPEKNRFSQHANTLAILTHMVEGAEATALMEKILSDKSLTQATIYFKYYVHRALVEAGLGDRYLDQLGDWRTQLSNGLTTWAEISDVNVSRSDCHAWGSSPNIEFFRTVLGIDTGAPGFKKAIIKPHLGPLAQAKGSIPHPKGEIAVDYAMVKGKWKINIDLPPDTGGVLVWKGKSYELRAGEKNTLTP